MRLHKKKIDIKQGERDYKKWMAMLKEVKSSAGKQAIDQIDQKLCKMIIDYGKNLQRAGIDVTSTGEKNAIKVNDNEYNSNKDYIDLETVGIV